MSVDEHSTKTLEEMLRTYPVVLTSLVKSGRIAAATTDPNQGFIKRPPFCEN
jgi:hypothetical protein